jgi:GDP-L-fucose synthase
MHIPESNSAHANAEPIAAPVKQWRAGISIARKRIVVTGGAGFLGRVLVHALRESGCTQVIVPRRADCDLTRKEDIDCLLNAARPNVVFHLAATVDNPSGQANAAASFHDNVIMTTQLIEAVARRGIEKLVCLGSATSYPAHAAMPLREVNLFAGLPEASRAAHGVAKRLALTQARACRQQYGLRFAYLIPTNLYGPDDNFDPRTSYVIPSLVRTFVEAADSGLAQVVLRGAGNASRDFLHVEDCAEAILLAVERYESDEPANLGSGTEVQIRDLACRIASLAGYAGEILWDSSFSDGPPRRVLDTDFAASAFGFRARRTLQQGLSEVIDWYRLARERNVVEIGPRVFASRA